MKKEGKNKYIPCRVEVVEFQVERNFAADGVAGFYVKQTQPISDHVSFDMYVHQQLNPMGNRNANAFGKTDWSDNEGAVW